MSIVRGRVASLLCAGAVGLGVMFVALPTHAQQTKKSATRYVSPAGYITGVVQGEKGP
jgi:hypothetical protein